MGVYVTISMIKTLPIACVLHSQLDCKSLEGKD